MSRVFALLLLALLIACSSASPRVAIPEPVFIQNPSPNAVMTIVPVYIDKSFNAQELAQIESAFDQWTYSLNGYMEFKIVARDVDFEHLKEVVDSVIDRTGQGLEIIPETDASAFESPSALAYVPGAIQEGKWYPSPEIHIVRDRIGERDLRQIVLHEIGHTLGLDHSPVKNTLMYFQYPQNSPCVDRLTMQTLSSLRSRIDWHHTNYCTWPL